MVFVDLIYNLTILIALAVVSGFIDRHSDRSSWRGQCAQGVVFGVTTVIGMLRPFPFGPGVIFDGRSVMISLCGLFYGLVPVLIASVMAALCRLVQGGMGVVTGILVIGASAFIGAFLHTHSRLRLVDWTARHFWQFGLVVHGVMLAIMLTLPWETALGVLKTIGFPVLLTYPLATILIGKILADQERQTASMTALQASETRFKLSMEATQDGLWDWDIPSGKTYFSPGYYAMLGYHNLPEQTTGVEFWTQHIHPDDKDRVWRINQDCVAGKQDAFEVEYRMKNHEGDWVWILGRGKCLERDADNQARRMIGTHVNLTARKQAEEKHLQTLASLRQLQSRNQALLSALPDLMFVFDRSGVFLDFHVADQDALLIPPEQFVGKPVRLVLPPSIAELTLVQLQRLFQTGKVQEYQYTLDIHGQERTYECRMVKCGDDGALSIVRDVTEPRRAEQEKKLLQQQIQQAQKMESLGVLAGGVAHDFNNILMAIMGHAELAQTAAELPAEANRSLDQIVTASRRAAQLCQQMLAYSGKSLLAPEIVKFSDLIAEMVSLLRTTISRKIVLQVAVPSDLPRVSVDPTQIRQVLMNLMINAADAIGEGSGQIDLMAEMVSCEMTHIQKLQAAEAMMPGQYLRFRVRDTGSGMSPATVARIFEPFFSTKFTGRGLGLAAVLGIVKAHRGGICVESVIGKGTMFEIFLPCLVPQQAPEPGPKSPTLTAWNGRGTVLLVDDEPDLLEIGSQQLSALGFSVMTAQNGQEAVDRFRENPTLDLIIMDLTMPVRDGLDATREISALSPATPIILVSGFAEEDLTQRSALSGVTETLQKPYSVQSLQKKLAQVFPSFLREKKRDMMNV
jgi:PAS domain S-box-containing protein